MRVCVHLFYISSNIIIPSDVIDFGIVDDVIDIDEVCFAENSRLVILTYQNFHFNFFIFMLSSFVLSSFDLLASQPRLSSMINIPHHLSSEVFLCLGQGEALPNFL